MRTDVSPLFVLLAMVACHVLDDYGLQPAILSSLKQRAWWERNAPSPLYRHDYLMALAMHAASWSFLVQLPIAWLYGFDPPMAFFLLYAANVLCHAGVDHVKANMGKINLIADQTIHLCQILATWYVMTA